MTEMIANSVNLESSSQHEATILNFSPKLTIKNMVKEGHYHSEAGLRHLIFHCETNGFKKCIRRVGRRVLIDLRSFYSYIDEQTNV